MTTPKPPNSAPAAPQLRKPASSEPPSTPRTIAAVFERRAPPPAGSGGSGSPASAPFTAIVVAQLGPDATPRPGLRITTARAFGPTESGAIRAFLKESGVELILRLVPPTEALCRPTLLPEGVNGDRAALADALTLIAETELPGHLPWYRRTAGIVPIGPARKSGLLAGWHRRDARSPGSPSGAPAVQPDPLAEALHGLPQLWTVEALPLCIILSRSIDPAATPALGSSWIACTDRAAGSACLLALAPDGAVRLRNFRAANTDPEAWRSGLAAAIDETLDGLPDTVNPTDLPRDASSTILASPGLQPIVAGERRDARWLDQFAIPAATLEAFADPDPASRSLFNLHAVEPRRRANPIQRLITFFSSPMRAAAAILLCTALVLGARFGVAYARHELLQKQVGEAANLESRIGSAERRVAFYAALRDRRWPMTKLLADIAGATPVGIELDMLEITQGEPITIRGVSENNALVNTFRENLNKTRIFESVTTPNIGSSAGAVTFQLQARPASITASTGVTYAAAPADDFVKNPLGKRIHGDAWTTDDAGSADEPPPRSSASDRTAAGPSARRDDSFNIPPRAARPGSASASADKPPPSVDLAPLTDEQIAAMDKTAAMKEFSIRRKAAAEATDKAVKERLTAEAERCKLRMQEAGKAAPAATAPATGGAS